MKVKEFNQIVTKLTKQVEDILIKKTAEYNLDADRLEFFKTACQLKHEEAHQALLGYVSKQIVSEFDMGMSKDTFTEERWLEKIVDIICYEYLLYAVLKDTKKFKEVKDESSR